MLPTNKERVGQTVEEYMETFKTSYIHSSYRENTVVIVTSYPCCSSVPAGTAPRFLDS